MQYESLDGYKICHVKNDAGDILRERRIILRLTQQEVADKAGINLRQYQRFELGERSIKKASFIIACQVLEALEMDIAAFYHGDYVIGEEICVKDGELCYKKTGKSINEEI